MAARGAQDWVDVTGAITDLVRVGILVADLQKRRPVASQGFGAPDVHIRMLNDRTRTDAYLWAIEKVVRPGDVVVDIGTGTGILAAAAARAGASRVYAIEMDPHIAAVAAQVFTANGVEDRVRLVHGASTSVDLPERADVLVSEVIGNDIIGERMMHVYADARNRHLKPDARMIPSEMAIVATPYQIPASHLARVASSPDHHERWRDWYGLDLSALGSLAPNPGRPIVSRPPRIIAEWTALAEPSAVATVPMDRDMAVGIDAEVTVEAASSGVINGVCLGFEARLSDGISLTNVPGRAADDCHWPAPVWPVEPIEVAAGQSITIRLATVGNRFTVTVGSG